MPASVARLRRFTCENSRGGERAERAVGCSRLRRFTCENREASECLRRGKAASTAGRSVEGEARRRLRGFTCERLKETLSTFHM